MFKIGVILIAIGLLCNLWGAVLMLIDLILF